MSNAQKEEHTPTPYYGSSVVAQWFGVAPLTVAKWRSRDSFPQSDIVIETDAGDIPGWACERKSELIAWRAARPGQAWRKGKKGEHRATSSAAKRVQR